MPDNSLGHALDFVKYIPTDILGDIESIIDYGSGDGNGTAVLAEHFGCTATGIDIIDATVHDERCEFVRSDIKDHMHGHKADLIVCLHILEGPRYDLDALAIIDVLLKNCKWLVIGCHDEGNLSSWLPQLLKCHYEDVVFYRMFKCCVRRLDRYMAIKGEVTRLQLESQ